MNGPDEKKYPEYGSLKNEESQNAKPQSEIPNGQGLGLIGFFRKEPHSAKDKSGKQQPPISHMIMSYLGTEIKEERKGENESKNIKQYSSEQIKQYDKEYYKLKGVSKDFSGEVKVMPYKELYMVLAGGACCAVGTNSADSKACCLGTALAAVCYSLGAIFGSFGFIAGMTRDACCPHRPKNNEPINAIPLPLPSEAIEKVKKFQK